MYLCNVYNQIKSFDSRYKFTAKELDTETDYTYFGARYYDSDLSNWISVDPLSDMYPGLSPYAYCANNPVAVVERNKVRAQYEAGSNQLRAADPDHKVCGSCDE